MLWLAAISPPGAQAALPTTVAENMAGVTEFQYKMMAISPSAYRYPRCHRVCNLLWNRQRALNPASTTSQELWRELYMLGVRTHLFNDWASYVAPYSIALPSTSVFEENRFGSPLRYVGVELPAGTGGAAVTLALTTDIMMSAYGVVFRAPTVGWFGGNSVTVEDPRCASLAISQPDPPGPGFSHFSNQGFCWWWNQSAQQWERVEGVTVHTFFRSITFDGPPSRTAGTYGPGDHPRFGVVGDSVGFANTKATLDAELRRAAADAGEYSTLMAWIDAQLGGDGTLSPGPEDLYGASNPAAPNLVHTCAGDPVNCATGNFFEHYQDTRVAGPGVTLSQRRTYNSQAAVAQTAPGPFGFGWGASFRDSLEFPSGSDDVIVHQENGSQVRFSLNEEDGSYSANSYVQATLKELSGGNFEYVPPSRLKFTFSDQGRLLSETDANGNATTLHYTGSNLTSVTDAVGRDLDFTYNTDGTVATVTDPAGHVVHYDYTAGDLTSVVDVGGETTEFAYDSDHQLTSVTDARGHVATANVYDSAHRVISQTDAQSHETTWDYSSGQTIITDPSGSVTKETFVDNLPTAIVRGFGTSSQGTTSFSYDEAFNLVRETDPNGGHWDSTYDIEGNRLSTKDPLGHETTYTYDDYHQVKSIERPGGSTTSMSYDSHGNMTGISQSPVESGHSNYRNLGYDGQGLLTAVYQGGSNGLRWTLNDYDADGNRTATHSPAGRVSTATYDDNGLVLTSTTPRSKTTTTVRNAYGLPTTVTDARAKTMTYGYDENLNVTDVTDRDGNHQTTTYDALNRPLEVHRADGSVSKTTYTASGEVASQVNGLNKTTSYTYDDRHRVSSITDPLARVTQFSYDAVGNKTSVEDAGGATQTLVYDDANRLTSIDYSSSSTPDVSYAYNVEGLRTSMTDGTGTSTYAYDVLGRLHSQTSGAGQQTTYHYDDWDRVTSIDYPDALTAVTVGGGGSPTHVTTGTVTRTYDKDDNLKSVADWLGNTTNYTYDADSNLTGIARPNGVNATYAYNDNDVLSSLTDGGPATSLGRSDASLLTGTNDGTTTASFGYDAAQRLTSGPSRTYTYDDADHLTQTATVAGTAITQQFDDAGQLLTRKLAGTVQTTYSYDNEGRRTATTPTSGTATALTWSQSDDLLSYTGPDASGGSSGSISEEYGYDGDGLRKTKTTSGQRTHQAYDLTGSLPQIITDGPTAYITGPGGLPIEQITAAGTVRYFSQDQLGSTTALTDALGVTVQSYSYDPYGQLTSATPTVENPFRYAGQYTDDATGFQYLRARYYDPTTGQFLSRDPLESSTLQPYSYADNNPTNATDPSGMLSWSDISGMAAGVLDAGSGGLSTRLAGSIWNFDVDCADFGAGFAVGQIAGTVIGPGKIGAAARGVRGAMEARATATGAARVAKAAGAERASTPFGRLVQSFKEGDDWVRTSAHAEQATGKAYRGGMSVEEVFERGEDRLVRHRIYGSDGDILHETFRPYAKFGAP
ncbi:MAG: RHS repeat-associated core domain-containing protein [Baekduia sp.]